MNTLPKQKYIHRNCYSISRRLMRLKQEFTCVWGKKKRKKGNDLKIWEKSIVKGREGFIHIYYRSVKMLKQYKEMLSSMGNEVSAEIVRQCNKIGCVTCGVVLKPCSFEATLRRQWVN